MKTELQLLHEFNIGLDAIQSRNPDDFTNDEKLRDLVVIDNNTPFTGSIGLSFKKTVSAIVTEKVSALFIKVYEPPTATDGF